MVCTLASTFGAVFGAVFLFVLSSTPCSGTVVTKPYCEEMNLLAVTLVLPYLFAWGCYFAMASAWINSSGTPKWVPIAGTSAALSWFTPLAITATTSQELLGVFLVPAVLVSPAMLLAIYLVAYHMLKSRNGSINAA
jgi:hypothetical protein